VVSFTPRLLYPRYPESSNKIWCQCWIVGYNIPHYFEHCLQILLLSLPPPLLLLLLLALQPNLGPGRLQDTFPFPPVQLPSSPPFHIMQAHPLFHPFISVLVFNSSAPIWFRRVSFFIRLWSNIRVTWPAHLKLPIYMVLTMSGSQNNTVTFCGDL
jgi:hypothetical protein